MNYVIDNKELVDCFYPQTSLWGLTSSESIYSFCYKINQALNLNLERKIEWDLEVKRNSMIFQKTELFNENNEENVMEIMNYFPIFYQEFEDESELILYCNKYKGNILVNEQKEFDFLLLVKRCFYKNELKNLDKFTSSLDFVNHCKKIEIKNQKWKELLII